MSEINILTKYLNPHKHTFKSIGKNELLFVRIDQKLIDVNGDHLSDHTIKTYFEQPFDDAFNFRRTYEEIFYRESNLGSLYVEITSENPFYYFKKQINGENKFLTLEKALDFDNHSGNYETLNDQNFQAIELAINQRLFYNKETNYLYLSEEYLPTLSIVGEPNLNYNPNELNGLKNGSYDLQYTDHAGANSSTGATWFRILQYDLTEPDGPEKRSVHVTLNPESGKVYWYPRLTTENSKLCLYYDYWIDESDILATNRGYAIRLEFHHHLGFLAFMNLTYFRNEVSLLKTNTTDKRRVDFFKAYISEVEKLLQSAWRLNSRLRILFYLPREFFVYQQRISSEFLGLKFLWLVIDSAITQGTNELELNDYGTDSEKIVIKLLSAIQSILVDQKKSIKDANDYLLETLLYEGKIEGESYLRTLFRLIDGNSFKEFNSFLYQLWYDSSYADPRNPVYKETSSLANNKDRIEDYNYPVAVLPYETNKILGFYSSNMNIEFIFEDLIEVTADDSSIDDIVGFFNTESGKVANKIIEDQWVNIYHPLQPIYLSKINSKNPIKLHRICPAILLKSNEESSFWSNLRTAGEYALEILVASSGISILSSLRHLSRLSKIANATIAYTDLSTSSLRVLLKLTQLEDAKIGKELEPFLSYLEIASMFASVGSLTLIRGLKNSARSVVKNDRNISKHLDNLKKKGVIDERSFLKAIDELKNIGGVKIIKTQVGYIKNLKKSIKPSKVPNGFQQFDIKLSDEIYGKGINTRISYGADRVGHFTRYYNSSEKTFTFSEGFLQIDGFKKLPTWVEDVKIPLVKGKGIPTQAYYTLRQMNLLKVGEIKKVNMSMIQNIETMGYLSKTAKEKGMIDFTKINILEAPSMNYVKTTMQQAGYNLKDSKILINKDAFYIDYNTLKNAGFNISDDFLVRYELDLGDITLINFDIEITTTLIKNR